MSTLMQNLFNHYKRVICHKWYVLVSGLKVGVPFWNLVVHDFSKFMPFEAKGYVRRFYGDGDLEAWSHAWNHHQKNNPHHWEYWVMTPNGLALEMPDKYAREMFADWLGASKGYGGSWPESINKWEWWQRNFKKINLHPKTRTKVLRIATDYFFSISVDENKNLFHLMLSK